MSANDRSLTDSGEVAARFRVRFRDRSRFRSRLRLWVIDSIRRDQPHRC